LTHKSSWLLGGPNLLRVFQLLACTGIGFVATDRRLRSQQGIKKSIWVLRKQDEFQPIKFSCNERLPSCDALVA
jgi:hypothetical protein